MTPGRRIVRVTDNAFDKVDQTLGETRSAHGSPSAADFIEVELPKAIERLASDFESLSPAIPGVPSLRLFVSAGNVVASFSVIGVLLSDGSIAILDIEIDL